MKKITSSDVKQVVRKVTWTSGITYDMYRHDITSSNTSKPSGATRLYDANYYIVNSDYRVYICLKNGVSPEYPNGQPSLDEPTFTDLEPREAGTSGDGYIWKYLFTIAPSDIIKFDSTDYIPVPRDWITTTDSNISAVRSNAGTSGQLKIVTITNRGVGLGTANRVYTRVPIDGDGNGAECTISINNDSKVESIAISRGGSGYTFGRVNLSAGGVPTGTTTPTFNVIIPPHGGHGADIYRELGASNVMMYSRFSNDDGNADFITGNQIARIGIIENPEASGSTEILQSSTASGVYAVRLAGAGYSTGIFEPDSFITQTIGVGSTAVGRVVSYDQPTGVLKYWQDRSMAGFNTNFSQNANPQYGLKLHRFTSSVTAGGSLDIVGIANTFIIDSTFTGVSTAINSKTYYLGQSFTNGVSNPEVKKYSGNLIYVDNRPSVTRSSSQKEDVKVILQF
jgi:hypothetical protein